MAGAVLLGLAMAEVGVSIQHDANHGAYLPRTWWSWLMAATLDAVRAFSMLQTAISQGTTVHNMLQEPCRYTPVVELMKLTMKLNLASAHSRANLQTLPFCALDQDRSSRGYSARCQDTPSVT